MNLQLGFTTGSLHKEFATKEALASLKNSGIKVVELGFAKMDSIYEGWADNLSKEDLESFDYVSLHSPIIQYGDNSETKLVFEKIGNIDNIRKLDLVVIHPNTIEDFSVFDTKNFPIGFENMDNRKLTHKTSEEMKRVLENNDNYSLVLDVNHVYSNDKTMSLAKEFYSKSGSRIKEIHLSGYDGYHEPLFKTKQTEIIEAIQDFNVPIINEATIASGDIKTEMDYMIKEIEQILSER
jgi:hypothetical protein